MQNSQWSLSYRYLSEWVTSISLNFFLRRPKSMVHGIRILQHYNILHSFYRIKKYFHNACCLILCCRCVKVVSVRQELGLLKRVFFCTHGVGSLDLHACDIMLWWKKSPTILTCRLYSTLHPFAYLLMMQYRTI